MSLRTALSSSNLPWGVRLKQTMQLFQWHHAKSHRHDRENALSQNYIHAHVNVRSAKRHLHLNTGFDVVRNGVKVVEVRVGAAHTCACRYQVGVHNSQSKDAQTLYMRIYTRGQKCWERRSPFCERSGTCCTRPACTAPAHVMHGQHARRGGLSDGVRW